MYFLHSSCCEIKSFIPFSSYFSKVKICDGLRLGLVFGMSKVNCNALFHHCFDHFDKAWLIFFICFFIICPQQNMVILSRAVVRGAVVRGAVVRDAVILPVYDVIFMKHKQCYTFIACYPALPLP